MEPEKPLSFAAQLQAALSQADGYAEQMDAVITRANAEDGEQPAE